MSNERILIVEDSTFFASVVTRTIREETAFEVDRVGSFQEARQYLKKRRRGLFAALLDLHLPDSPHGEVVDYFVAQGVPSIVFTGEFNDRVRDVVMSKNVVDYVLKEGPDSLHELIAALERLRRNQEIKVLVVDDSASARNIVSVLLRTHQYQVLEAENGEDALVVLQNTPGIRLLISDHTMPGMSGVELVRAIRARHPRERLAIVGISAETDPLISARFIKSGANDFLRKPFLVEEFHCRIRQNVELLEHITTIREMGDKDNLTGLCSRRGFLRRGRAMQQEALLRNFPVLAVLLDVDHLKRINNTLGHDAGDEILREMADRLRERFGRNGLVARFGGDEFALLLPGTPLEQARKALEVFVNDVAARPVQTSAGEVALTVSAGLTGESGESLEAMLQRADEMLVLSKQQDRNRLTCAQG
ncbi:MAG: diguanylate cyclase [Desulfovibrio sp.]